MLMTDLYHHMIHTCILYPSDITCIYIYISSKKKQANLANIMGSDAVAFCVIRSYIYGALRINFNCLFHLNTEKNIEIIRLVCYYVFMENSALYGLISRFLWVPCVCHYRDWSVYGFSQ